MNASSQVGYLRLKQILGDPKANPPVPPLVPVCKTTWYEGIKLKRFPQGIKIGERLTVWKKEEVYDFIEKRKHHQKS